MLTAHRGGFQLGRNARATETTGPLISISDVRESLLHMTTEPTADMPVYDYIRDGAEIYRRSFSIIRSEANLSRFAPDEAQVAVRIIHACGMVEIAEGLRFSPGSVAAARTALKAGAPILCDGKMVANGITRARLPANNEIICTLDAPEVPALAKQIGNTRTAASMDLWGDKMKGAIVAFGNAPTGLFHLFEMLDRGAPMPATVLGFPVGFVGAAESKEALANDGRVPFIIMEGRRGGSAMAAAAINALASEKE
jgi:precorrin-8X/cobalt-precorrin-8 methylmutase